MANGITAEPPRMTSKEIDAMIGERIGGGGGVRQDFESFRYNVPQGDFGTAYPKSRRKMRMEEDFRQYELQELQRQKTLQQMDIAERQYGLQFQAEQRIQEKQRLDLDREGKVQEQAQLVMESIRGTTLPDGQRTRPINIEDDDAVERLQSTIYSNPFGMESQATKEAVTMMLNDALSIRERRLQDSQEQEMAAATLSARSGKPMKEFGEYTENGIFRPNLNTITKEAEALKEVEAKKAEEKTISTETRRAEAQAKVTEDKSLSSQERELNKEIRVATEALRKLNASMAGRTSLSETQSSNLQAAKDTLLDRQIDKAALRGLVFDDQEEFKKARDEGKIPSGVRAFIGRTAIDIP